MPFNDPCARTDLIGRLVVSEPAALRREPWATHLEQCRQCRAEWSAHTRALAVFRHFEAERLAAAKVDYGWEQLVKVIPSRGERHTSLLWMRLPLAAAVSTMLLVSGLAVWDVWENREPAPARIVKLLPHEQDQLEITLQHSLDPALLAAAASSVEPASMDVALQGAPADASAEIGLGSPGVLPPRDRLIFSRFSPAFPSSPREMPARLALPGWPGGNQVDANTLTYPVYRP